MGYKALYREWRPQTFEDVVGQEHITTTLKNEIQNNKVAHAYLFCGTRGTGKTSTAKVFAKALNCLHPHNGEPCNECEMCRKISEGREIDVIELDAASNNGIDKIRDIIEDTKYPAQEAKYKVYIMDEVHMLSLGAVNAFLKTLEEPPENVVFILATTDPQKLPITILSRCQKFDFKRINQKEIQKRLTRIVNEKNIECDEKSLNLVARVCDGAMRDALSILDQAIAIGENKVSYEDLVSILGLVTNEALFKITDAVIQRNVEKAVMVIDRVVYQGKDIQVFLKDLIQHFRNLMMVKVTKKPEEVLDMSVENIQRIKEQAPGIRIEEIMRAIRILQEAETKSRTGRQGRIYLELALVKICKIEYDTSNEVILSRLNKMEQKFKNGEFVSKTPEKSEKEKENEKDNKKVTGNTNLIEKTEKAEEVHEEENIEGSVTIEKVKQSWSDIMEIFRNRRQMLIVMKFHGADPYKCINNKIYVRFKKMYDGNVKALEIPETRKKVEETFSEFFKEPVTLAYQSGNESQADISDNINDMLSGIDFEVRDE